MNVVPSYARVEGLDSIRRQAGYADHSAGYFLYAAAYDAGMFSRGPFAVVEIGVGKGYSTVMLLCGIHDSMGSGRLVSVDIIDSVTGCWEARRLPDRIGEDHCFIGCDSREPATVQKVLQEVHGCGLAGIQLLVVDGGHDRDTCLADLRNYGEHVIYPGGKIYVHDSRHKPVAAAIKTFCGEFGFDCGHVRGYGDFTVLSKPY